MVDEVYDPDASSLSRDKSLSQIDLMDELMDRLSVELPPAWDVEQQIDYLGEMTIISCPPDHDPKKPTFIIYSKNGKAYIATVIEDKWQGSGTIGTCKQAVADSVRYCSLDDLNQLDVGDCDPHGNCAQLPRDRHRPLDRFKSSN